MKRRVPFAAVAMMIFLAIACKNNAPVPPDGSQCDSTAVSFNQDVVPIMALYCNDPNFGNCHQAGSLQGELITYQGVRAKVANGSFEFRVFDLQDMPPSASGGPTVISQQDLILLDCWIRQGAPDN